MANIGVARKGGKKNRKYGRNEVKCARYRAEGRREKNKARRAKKRANKLAKRREAKASLPVLGVVQLVRTPDCGSGGREFKSRLSPHYKGD